MNRVSLNYYANYVKQNPLQRTLIIFFLVRNSLLFCKWKKQMGRRQKIFLDESISKQIWLCTHIYLCEISLVMVIAINLYQLFLLYGLLMFYYFFCHYPILYANRKNTFNWIFILNIIWEHFTVEIVMDSTPVVLLSSSDYSGWMRI